MAFQKSKTLDNGVNGDYWRITSIVVNRNTMKISYQLSLFLDASHANTASLGYRKFFNFSVSSQEMCEDLVAKGYERIKFYANLVKTPAVEYQAPVAEIPATYDQDGNELTPLIPAVPEIIAKPAVYKDPDLQGQWMSKNWVYLYKPEEHNVVSYRIEDPAPWLNNTLAAINPDTSKLDTFKRHHLKVVDNVLVECSEEEKKLSNEFHSKDGKTSLYFHEVKVVEKEVVKEIPVEIKVDRLVTKYKMPLWSYFTHGGLVGLVAYLLFK